MSAVRLKSGPRQRGVLLGKRRERSVTEEISLDEKSVLSFRVSHAKNAFHMQRLSGSEGGILKAEEIK